MSVMQSGLVEKELFFFFARNQSKLMIVFLIFMTVLHTPRGSYLLLECIDHICAYALDSMCTTYVHMDDQKNEFGRARYCIIYYT